MISFEKLEVYTEGINLAQSIYKITKGFPKDELFGLTGQLRRAAVSIACNIAEGSSRTKKDFAHFIDLARGSCFELVPLLTIALNSGYITDKQFEELYAHIEVLAKRMHALKKSIVHDL